MPQRAIIRGWLPRCGVLLFLLLTCGGAQNLSVGFAGGGASTKAFETINAGVPDSITSYSQSKDYVVGVMLEYGLAGGLSLEADALYRELHLTVAFVEPSRVLYGVSPSPVVTWELPVMAKYRFHGSKVGPFVEAGPAFRPTTNLNASPSHYGVAAGVGLATWWKQFEITPMVRYTRWTHERRLENLAESDSNQVELLVGVSTRPRSPWHPLSSRISLGLVEGTTLIHDVPTNSSAFIGSQTVVAGGVSTNQQTSGMAYVSGSDTFLLGPALEAGLPKHFFVEVDAVYHPIESSRHRVLTDGTVFDSFSGAEGRTWEFPILGKYKAGTGRVKPFIEAGPSFRLLTENSSTTGVSAGAGVEVRLRSLKIEPAGRFTHWRPQGDHGAYNTVIVNQVEFLTGFLL